MNPCQAPAEFDEPIVDSVSEQPPRLFCVLASLSGLILIVPLWIFLPQALIYYLPWPGWVATAIGRQRPQPKWFWGMSSITTAIAAIFGALQIEWEPHATWSDPSLLFLLFLLAWPAVGSIYIFCRTSGDQISV